MRKEAWIISCEDLTREVKSAGWTMDPLNICEFNLIHQCLEKNLKSVTKDKMVKTNLKPKIIREEMVEMKNANTSRNVLLPTGRELRIRMSHTNYKSRLP